MSNNFEVKEKKALFMSGKRLTDYKWDDIRIYIQHEVIIATNHDDNFTLFSKKTGEMLFELDKHFSYKITPHYVELAIQDMGMAFYGAVSFEGEIIVPFAFGSVKPTNYAGIYEVTLSKGTKAYYITKTDQVINGDDIHEHDLFEYDVLIDNEWKRYWYSRMDNKYVCMT